MSRRFRRGFSLAEMIIAIFILGIGVISVAALFPVGLTQQQRSADAIMGPTVAKNALETLRAKLSPDDFGWFDRNGNLWDASRYNPNDPSTYIGFDPFYGLDWLDVQGDWGWRRPAFYLDHREDVRDQFNFPRDISAGSIDIFRNRLDIRSPPDTDTEIPFNTAKYPSSDPPGIIFTQEERWFPQQSTDTLFATGELGEAPQYVWDCMFRRWQGRIEVAIFVYRAQVSGGGGVPYRAVRFTSRDDDRPRGAVPVPPPLPAYNFLGGGPAWDEPWTGAGPDGDPNTPQDNAIIPGTEPGQMFIASEFPFGWQAPGQWLLDQNGNVHRVLAGRRSSGDGPVELTRAPVPADYGRAMYIRNGDIDGADTFELFYIPPVVIDGITGREFKLTPVYATVKEL